MHLCGSASPEHIGVPASAWRPTERKAFRRADRVTLRKKRKKKKGAEDQAVCDVLCVCVIVFKTTENSQSSRDGKEATRSAASLCCSGLISVYYFECRCGATYSFPGSKRCELRREGWEGGNE